jgi:hypothetical protein
MTSDAGRAYRAMARLAADAKETVRFLQTRLCPVAAPDKERLVKLLGDLDSVQFALRKKASDELEKYGEMALPALQAAALKKPPLELSRRLAELREKALQAHVAPEKLRTLRAVFVLERIATPAARTLLQALANGAPEARLTQEARAALGRARAPARGP